jgi:hypothetical protein
MGMWKRWSDEDICRVQDVIAGVNINTVQGHRSPSRE